MRFALAQIAVLFSFAVNTLASAPLAPHQLVEVDAGAEVVITLSGYDLDGDDLNVMITSLPSSGVLYQLSQVYSNYGYDPKRGVAIDSPGTVLTGSLNRLVYARPSMDSERNGKWASFTYTVSDGKATSAAGTVTLVPKTGVITTSDFLLGSEEWKIVGNKLPVSSATYEPSSRGAVNHYIYGMDDLINVGQVGGGGSDSAMWYFSAPSKFLGNYGIAYGGELKFTLSSAAGDFSKGNENFGAYLVELSCTQCNVNAGVTISFPLNAVRGGFDGKDKSISLTLHEKAGWLKDPKNSLKQWKAPTKCEFIEVLSGLSGMKILGDFTKWYETVLLDNVSIVNGKEILPICAQGSPDASICSC